MRILIQKEWTYKPEGLTYYQGEHDVSDEIAVQAVIDRATETPEAVALAEEKGALEAADKALSKMTKPELLTEVRRLLAGEPDKDMETRIADLESDIEAGKTALKAAQDELEVLRKDADAVLAAHNGLPNLSDDHKCETLADLAALIVLMAESGGSE